MKTIQDFTVTILSYSSLNILKIDISGCGYVYDVSPFIYEKFKRMLGHNKGKALSFLRGSEI